MKILLKTYLCLLLFITTIYSMAQNKEFLAVVSYDSVQKNMPESIYLECWQYKEVANFEILMQKFERLFRNYQYMEVDVPNLSQIIIEQDTTIYDSVEQMPTWTEDLKPFFRYFRRNLSINKSDTIDMSNCNQLLISFVVEKNGTITNIALSKYLAITNLNTATNATANKNK